MEVKFGGAGVESGVAVVVRGWKGMGLQQALSPDPHTRPDVRL